MDNTNQSFFTNKCTNIAKGIAVLLLLFHHLGLNTYLHIFDKGSTAYLIAQNCKVCVAIFLILSGYGLNASFNKKWNGKNFIVEVLKFSIKHLFKLLINFWIIYVIFVSIGHFTGMRTVQEVYGNDNLFKYLVIDFLGISDIFKTPKYNLTWWFMGLIIILYISFPIWKFLLRKTPIILIAFAIFINKIYVFEFYNAINMYLIYFVIGMMFSEYLLFDKLKEINRYKFIEIISSILFAIVCILFRIKYKEEIYNILAALSIIGLGNGVLFNCAKPIQKIFEFLGRNSSNMFMLHTFIYSYFFADFFVSLEKWYIMYVVLVVSSLLISIFIEIIKKLVKFIFNKTKNRIQERRILKDEKIK